MTGSVGARQRTDASIGEVALATGVVGAIRSFGPTSIPRTRSGIGTIGAASFALGAAAGVAGEGAARLLDRTTGLDRQQSHILIGAGGLATALFAHRFSGTAGVATATVGSVLAATGTIGAVLDIAHGPLDEDGDGHILPTIPTWAKVGVGGVVVGALALKFGKAAIATAHNAKGLAGSAAEVDKAGAALGELIPRSELTVGPKLFLGARIEDGFGTVAKRVVMPHEIKSAAVRTALDLPATGVLSSEQRAAVAIRSMAKQGAYDVDAAGKAMVDLHLLGSPTGMGGLNVAPVMTAEQLVRTATYDAQYGAKPSVQSLGKVDQAIDDFMAMAKAHKAQVATLPSTAQSPSVGIATSLGGLQFDRLIEREGIGVLDQLGLQKIVTLGAPVGLSKLDPATLPEGFHIRATFEEFAKLSDEAVAKARFIELRNADDPVPKLRMSMLWKRPDWFPGTRPFTPVESFAQHGVDITTAITRGTGATIGTNGHEYRSVVSNEAFARAIGLGRFGDEALHGAATKAQDTALSEAKRVRDMLSGAAKAAPKPTP